MTLFRGQARASLEVLHTETWPARPALHIAVDIALLSLGTFDQA